MKKIHIVGMNSLLIPFVNDLAEHGCEVVITNGHQFDEIDQRVKQRYDEYSFFNFQRMFLKKYPQISIPFYFPRLKDNLSDHKPDVILVMDFIRVWFMQVMIYKLFNPHVRIVLYSETKRKPNVFVSRILFKFFVGILKVSKKYIHRIVTYTPEGVEYLSKLLKHGGVECIPVPLERTISCKEMKQKHDQIRFLMPARFVSYKRHIDVIRALEDLSQQTMQRLSFTFIGEKMEVYSEVYEFSQRKGLPIIFKDKVTKEQMEDVYKEHDVLVLPSENEAIGMVVPEAMSCGLATITSDTVGANVYVKEGVTGLISITGDHVSLAQCIEKMVTQIDISLMGERACKHLKEHFDREELCGRMRSVLLD